MVSVEYPPIQVDIYVIPLPTDTVSFGHMRRHQKLFTLRKIETGLDAAKIDAVQAFYIELSLAQAAFARAIGWPDSRWIPPVSRGREDMIYQLFGHYRNLKVLDENMDVYRAIATIEAAAAAQTTRYLQDPSKADDIEALRKEYEKEHVRRVRKWQRYLQDPPSAMTRIARWAADLLRQR